MLVQTDAFQAMQARALGMGENGELVFALTADAPPPPQIVPLGARQRRPPLSGARSTRGWSCSSASSRRAGRQATRRSSPGWGAGSFALKRRS